MSSTTNSPNEFFEHSNALKKTFEVSREGGTKVTWLTSLVYDGPETAADGCSTSREVHDTWANRNPERAARVAAARKRIAELSTDAPKDLRSLRLQAGLSQVELAQRTSTSQAQIARIESGRQEIYLSTASAWCEALGCGLDAIRAAFEVSKEKACRG